MLYKTFIVVCVVSVLLVSCLAGKEAHNSAILNRSVRTVYAESDTGIVFVIMKIYTDSLTHSTKILVQDKIYTTGRVKDHATGFARIENYITCLLYDGDNAIDSVRLEHPLHRHVEYLDENNKMQMKEIHQQEAEFSVRFQLKGQGNRIKVLESLNNGKMQELKMILL